MRAPWCDVQSLTKQSMEHLKTSGGGRLSDGEFGNGPF